MQLKRFDIDIDSWENGAWLPNRSTVNPRGVVTHGDTYAGVKGPKYGKWVSDMLQDAQTPTQAREILQEIRAILSIGETP